MARLLFRKTEPQPEAVSKQCEPREQRQVKQFPGFIVVRHEPRIAIQAKRLPKP